MGALAGCGGGGSSGGSTPDAPVQAEALTTNGRVYPAVAGLVFAEFGASGRELQRSTATADDGSFQFTRRLTGARVEAWQAVPADRVQPVHSMRLDSGTPESLEVTPLTTWFDQLVVHGVARTTASNTIRNLVATNCPALAAPLQAPALTGAVTLPAADHDWMLSAAAAYLQAGRKLGLGPQLDFPNWDSALQRHGATLSQLCTFSAAISAPGWGAAQADRLRQEAQVTSVDADRLAQAIAGARAQGLALLALGIQQVEFPTQTVVPQAAAANVTGSELALGADFTQAQYLLWPAAKAGARNLVASPTQANLAITSSGALVKTLQGSASATGTDAAKVRLVNQGRDDKRVHLVIDGQDMGDLAGYIQQIVAMPVAYSGEPPYRKAWRYLMGHKRNTQQLAISFFQFQPDLWLNSVGSSYCEAQAAALYRIWTAMGYTARVHALTGHVTVEILVDGHWQVFDPYLQAYYTDRQGNIVGVAELAQDPTLITRPQTPLATATDAAYSAKVANIFATTEDNYIGVDYMTTEPMPLGNEVQVPAGGWLEVNAATDVMVDSVETGDQVAMSTMTLWVPPGYTGTLSLPLLLLNVKGAGSVQLLGRVVDANGDVIDNRGLAGLGSLDTTTYQPGLGALLQWFYFNDSSDIGVSEIRIDSSGADGLYLTLMVNPRFFKTSDQLAVRAYGVDVDGLQFAPAGTF